MSSGEEKKQRSPSSSFDKAINQAVFENISEDLRDILNTLESIKGEGIEQAQELSKSLKTELSALLDGLNALPNNFDDKFHSKMNDILDVSKEIDEHTKNLNYTLEVKVNDLFKSITSSYTKEINNKINGLFLTSYSMLFIFGLSCSILGGGLTSILVWYVSPKLF